MKIIFKREINRYQVIKDNKILYSSYLRLDCEQYIFAKTRRWA